MIGYARKAAFFERFDAYAAEWRKLNDRLTFLNSLAWRNADQQTTQFVEDTKALLEDMQRAGADLIRTGYIP